MEEESIEMSKIDLKIPKEVFDFLQQMAVRIEIAKGGKYMYMPYWIEIRDEEKGMVRFHSLDFLPEELKTALIELREKPVIESQIKIEDKDEATRESSIDPAGEPSGEN